MKIKVEVVRKCRTCSIRRQRYRYCRTIKVSAIYPFVKLCKSQLPATTRSPEYTLNLQKALFIALRVPLSPSSSHVSRLPTYFEVIPLLACGRVRGISVRLIDCQEGLRWAYLGSLNKPIR